MIWTAGGDADAVLGVVTMNLAKAVRDSCSALLLDDTGTALYARAHHQGTPDDDRLRPAPASPLALADHPMLASVLATGEPHISKLTPETLQPPQATNEIANYAATVGLHSVMVVPIRGRTHARGVLVLSRHRRTPDMFGPSDRELALVVADHAGLALDNAATHSELIASRQEQEQFFQTSPIPMFAFDVQTFRILAVNAAAQKLYGYEQDEFMRLTLSDLRAPDAPPLAALLDSLGDRVARATTKHRRKDGSYFDAEGASHVGVVHGRTARIVVVMDATGLTTALRERDRAEARFERLFDAGILGIMVTDSDGRIRAVNDAVVETFGYTREEMLEPAFRWARLPSPEWQAEHEAKLVRLRTSGLERPREREYVHKNGERVPVVTGAAVVQGSDEVISFVLDLRGQKWATAALEHLREARISEARFQLANRELEAFSYSVAHDLRAPLRAMSAFARLILDNYHANLDATGRDWLDEIVRNAARMAELIDALLSLSRLSRTELRVRRIDLGVLAREALARLRASEPARSVELETRGELTLDMDPDLARVLVENLVGNAWKFTSKAAAARIVVGEHQTEHGRTFFVRDNGAGFNMAYANKLFAPFQRLHAVRDFPGTGIGLATVQRIVHRHGGAIWADAREGEGATFSFTVRA